MNRTLDAGALIIGLLTSGATGSTRNTYTANGTFTLDHADGIVKAGDLILGTKNSQVTGGTRSANGTFNLNAGAIEAESIGWGAQSGDGTTTRNFNFTGGTVRNRTGGDLTISNVPVTLTGSGSRVFEATAGHTITVASTAVISGAGLGFTKAGEGTLVLAAANTYTGATTVEAGTLLLGADGTLGTNNAVVLSGGTLSSGGFVNELGTLAVTGAAAIDLGDGTGPLSFLNCSEIAWTGTLALTGRLGATALRFGTDANALTPDQLSRITLRGLSVKITEDGYIATIPGTLIILF